MNIRSIRSIIGLFILDDYSKVIKFFKKKIGMEKDEEANQLRISALSNQQAKKIALFPSLNSIIDYLTHKNQHSLKNLHTISIGSDSNANIKCSLIIVFAEVITKSMTQEQPTTGQNTDREEGVDNTSGCLIKFINIFFRHNIRFNQLTGLPESFLGEYAKQAEKISELISKEGLQVGEVFGYFREYQDIYLPIENSCLAHELENFLMKKDLLSHLIHFLKYYQRYPPQRNNSTYSDSLILNIANYLANHPRFTILLYTAIRSVLFFQYELYDAWDYQLEVADHTVFTAICDIFSCRNMKIDEENIVCFFGTWTIWSTQIYGHKAKPESEPQSPMGKEANEFSKLMKKFSLKSNQIVKKYFITEKKQQLAVGETNTSSGQSIQNPYSSTTRNYQNSSITFKQKYIQSSSQSINNSPQHPAQIQSQNYSAHQVKSSPKIIYEENNSKKIGNETLSKIKKSFSIEINLNELDVEEEEEIKQKQKKRYISIHNTNAKNDGKGQANSNKQPPINFTNQRKFKRNENRVDDGYSSNEIIEYLSESVRETMQSKRSKTSSNTKK